MSLTNDQIEYTRGLGGLDFTYFTPEVTKAIAEGYDNLSNTKESNWYDNLFGTKDGNMLGLNKDQWSGLGTLSGIGQGLYGLYQGGKRADLMKGYYDHQMGLQNEQAQMARDEYARLNQQREDATNRFMGTTPKKPTETA